MTSPTNLPKAGATIEPRVYYLGVAFHPAIKLERKRAYEFAVALSDYLDPARTLIEEQRWVFAQPMTGSPRSSLQVTVEPMKVTIGADFPKLAKEWFEERQSDVLRKFGESFGPKMILQSSVMLRGTLAIDGDARTFLAQRVMNIREQHFQQFARPVHMIGLRLVLPPFQVATDAGIKLVDSLVEVKAESLVEDPGQLFLEAEAQWAQPMPWNSETVSIAIRRQAEIAEYLGGNVRQFLRQAAQASGESEAPT